MAAEDPSPAARLVRDAREREAAEPSGRLPLPAFVEWGTFPFEGDLRVKPVADVELPEPPRHGAGGVGCDACERPDSACLWAGDDWRVRTLREPSGLPVVLILEPRAHHDLGDLPAPLADSMGRMIWRVERALMALGGIARVQVARWGDGSEHLHLWFLPRPDGFVQGRGTFLSHWDDVLPPRPVAEWEQTCARVREELLRLSAP